MTLPFPVPGEAELTAKAAIAAACATVAPTWPLDRFIAVNPWWERRGEHFSAVDAQLRALGGAGLAMPASYYRELWQRGEIAPPDLAAAQADTGYQGGLAALLAALEQDTPAMTLPLLSDVLDSRQAVLSAPPRREVITQQVSQFCAAWFDEAQASWHPRRDAGLYAAWRMSIQQDRGLPVLLGLPALPARIDALPATASGFFAQLATTPDFPLARLAGIGELALFRIKGWAAWCAWLAWQARLKGGSDDSLTELLAVRLAWESLLDDGKRAPDSPWRQWREAWESSPHHDIAPAQRELLVWQRAQEIAWQRAQVEQLARHTPQSSALARPEVQAVFCIDVRSEVFRRALEADDPQVQTLGFAGFFGLPIAYTPLGTSATQPLLPALLAPALKASDASGDAVQDAHVSSNRLRRLAGRLPFRQFQRLPIAGFTLVESLGLASLGSLITRSLARAPDPEDPALQDGATPRLGLEGPESLSTKVELAARVLRAMGLVRSFAPLVLLLGHGSQTSNNPHAAGLDCGACGGHSGETNARVLAALLNDPQVRAGLVAQGIAVPSDTRFVPGLHNTTTDEIQLFDAGQVPAASLARLRQSLAAAGERARAERAPALGLAALAARPEALLKSLRTRARDWAQTRPEWGLANNACFIVAPRARTRGLDLKGRAFLHDYDAALDADGKVLELIMTAPMIVTQWINLQYFASTVDNLHYGAGNKILHNVVGGRIGVFEGNSGDLRIGLPLQSVHDGEHWRHAPLRLSVFIEAGRDAIDRVIADHALLQQILDGQWLHLFRIEGQCIERRGNAGWQAWPTP